MSQTPLESIQQLRDALRAFAAERDWDQFHSPKNLSMALTVEAGELQEHFQWLSEEASSALSGEELAAVGAEVADVFIYLVRLADGGFLALHRQCTHLGCSVPWDEASGRFVCPCHSSVFDVRGDVLAPPAPRPLDVFAVRIENGIVKVDVSAPIRRSGFDGSQVVRG